MQKVPCTKCGELILPDTAERNEGVCMACKAGIRESMERSKAYYRKERELDRTDPERLYWKALVNRVHGEPGGLSVLSETEQAYFVLHILLGEVHNGGFEQFFYNHSGEYYVVVSKALLALGAQRTLRLLREAKEILFFSAEVPLNTGVRRQYLASHPIVNSERLDALDRELWSDPDALYEKLSSFAARHGLFALPHNNSLKADSSDEPRT